MGCSRGFEEETSNVKARIGAIRLATSFMTTDKFRLWARKQFSAYSGSVAYVATKDAEGNHGCGTAFHIGEGVFVTARHVIHGRNSLEIGFDDNSVSQELLRATKQWRKQSNGSTSIVAGPFFHPDEQVDVACFKVDPHPAAWIPLGGHLDHYLGQHELVLHRTLVFGYPPIPCTTEPKLVASVGEVNALVELRDQRHPHFIISTMARGGFSGGPVLVAYNEENEHGGTAVLGIVTQSLMMDGKPAEQGYLAVLTVEPIFECLERNNLCPRCQGYD